MSSSAGQPHRTTDGDGSRGCCSRIQIVRQRGTCVLLHLHQGVFLRDSPGVVGLDLRTTGAGDICEGAVGPHQHQINSLSAARTEHYRQSSASILLLLFKCRQPSGQANTTPWPSSHAPCHGWRSRTACRQTEAAWGRWAAAGRGGEGCSTRVRPLACGTNPPPLTHVLLLLLLLGLGLLLLHALGGLLGGASLRLRGKEGASRRSKQVRRAPLPNSCFQQHAQPSCRKTIGRWRAQLAAPVEARKNGAAQNRSAPWGPW